jgi:LPXTG-site transpeptidase (sortase) family protein
MLAAGCSAGSGTPVGGTKTTPAAASSTAASSTAAGAPTSPAGGAASTSSPAGSPTSVPTALASSVPVRLQIPDIGVDAPIIPLGLAADGTVQVPPIKANSPAGWYQGSPTPGQTGPSVILGHVTVGQYGDGVFRQLARLRKGSRVLVRLQDGASAAFTVDSVKTVAKDQFPTQEVYGNVDRPELRLITCGGPHTDNGYLDNVVVFATLAGTA